VSNPASGTRSLLRHPALDFRRTALQAHQLARAIKLVWEAAPGWTSFWIILLAIQGLLPLGVVYLTRPLVNAILAGVHGGGNWYPLIVPAGLMAAALLATEFSRAALGWVRGTEAELVQDHIQSLIHRTSIEADLAFYESPDFYDHLHLARDEASYRPLALLEKFGSVTQNSLTLGAMLAVLSAYGIGLSVALLLGTIPVLFIVLRYATVQHQLRVETTPIQRRIWYYDWLMTAGEAAPELRLFALGKHFDKEYRRLRVLLREKRIDLARIQSLAEAAAGACTLAVTAGALLWMVTRTLKGTVTLGELALVYQAFAQGSTLARELLRNLGELYQNTLFLGNLFEFLALKPQVVSPPIATPFPDPVSGGIEFRQITFGYPGSHQVALRDFDLTIPAGSLVAIVGPNGAGKSTLLKLLCRFYDPQAGTITIDGVDLREFSPEDLRRHVTVMFQQPMHYGSTVANNITLGSAPDGDNEELVRVAAQAAGADEFIKRLPEDYRTMLGHWFEHGVELSVGEWQRLALARAFMRQAPIIVLDEPTSSMDPWAEADWLARLRTLAAGRTTIMITHRFTSAMLADRIHVIDGGRLIESGSHQELIADGGRYADWWRTQGGADPLPRKSDLVRP